MSKIKPQPGIMDIALYQGGKSHVDGVENVLKLMADALVDGEQVKISSFGTFSVRNKAERVGRNPKTGEEVTIEPRRVLTFRPSHLMKDRVETGNSR